MLMILWRFLCGTTTFQWKAKKQIRKEKRKFVIEMIYSCLLRHSVFFWFVFILFFFAKNAETSRIWIEISLLLVQSTRSHNCILTSSLHRVQWFNRFCAFFVCFILSIGEMKITDSIVHFPIQRNTRKSNLQSTTLIHCAVAEGVNRFHGFSSQQKETHWNSSHFRNRISSKVRMNPLANQIRQVFSAWSRCTFLSSTRIFKWIDERKEKKSFQMMNSIVTCVKKFVSFCHSSNFHLSQFFAVILLMSNWWRTFGSHRINYTKEKYISIAIAERKKTTRKREMNSN